MWIKADFNNLITLSEQMYTPPIGSISKYLFGVQAIQGFGYAKWSQEIENAIDFEYEIVTELPDEEI